ncbi:hypothetical protein DC20_06020 [Rufibacter tibetensis]|uniref:Uncharacterized protein n=1 Tax=Rufibacter tibetensis TaxID=512763 RepID=A0A0P0CHB5_9BACT|nr:hypothetical protein DC20_06020 [Rufibacter tibetensis]
MPTFVPTSVLSKIIIFIISIIQSELMTLACIEPCFIALFILYTKYTNYFIILFNKLFQILFPWEGNILLKF